MNSERPIWRHIIIKLLKDQDKKQILKAGREKQIITCMGSSIRLSADFSSETLETRRQWANIKGKKPVNQDRFFNCLYPAKLSFKSKEEIKTLTDKQKLKEFLTTWHALLKEYCKVKWKDSRQKLNVALRNKDLNNSKYVGDYKSFII